MPLFIFLFTIAAAFSPLASLLPTISSSTYCHQHLLLLPVASPNPIAVVDSSSLFATTVLYSPTHPQPLFPFPSRRPPLPFFLCLYHHPHQPLSFPLITVVATLATFLHLLTPPPFLYDRPPTLPLFPLAYNNHCHLPLLLQRPHQPTTTRLLPSSATADIPPFSFLPLPLPLLNPLSPFPAIVGIILLFLHPSVENKSEKEPTIKPIVRRSLQGPTSC